jgi:hypothetical protein
LNPLVRNERFPSGYISSSSPGFTLTLDSDEHDANDPDRHAQHGFAAVLHNTASLSIAAPRTLVL